MATNLQTVFVYLNVTDTVGTINCKRLEEIRSFYNDLTKINPQDSLKILADNFKLIDDRENRDHINLCVANDNLKIVCQTLVNEYLEKKAAENRNARKAKQQTQTTINQSMTTESISEVICQIFIKQNHPFVVGFIDEFLFQTPDPTRSNKNDKSAKQLLPQRSVLNVFIRYQLMARGDTIDLGRPMAKLPLIDPITIVDEFDTWHFDHLHDLFKLDLIRENQVFPHRWQLAPNAKIFYKIFTANDLSNEESTIRNVDRPSTVSLEKFVEDVCEKQNNSMATKWIDALHSDDIFTFHELASIKSTEWDQLKTLSLNGKRVLKSYIDREKQMTANVKSNHIYEQKTIDSECELVANLHKIRLYFHYILADQFPITNIRTPAKLNVDCVDAAFEEMRQDGFADDGLFDQMKMFFLPLTMTEENLSIDDNRWKLLLKTRLKKKQELSAGKEKLCNKLAEVEDQYYNHDDAIIKLEKEIVEKRKKPIDQTSDSNMYDIFSLEDLLTIHRDGKDELEHTRYDLRTQIQTKENTIQNIESGLKEKNPQDTKRTNRDLIKPNRGFIMYGPPGTGKSDIMSTLSTRIGITMVAPPIAAGELNRPLVGESERIISDICMRCHRIPYLMCCISIDEIDSLTSKRNDKSSEGNVAKLSVLLSVIDGIKDVPNLMIFCATNRLHMMDEAFLRRMQGKFFVGRPSSLARKSILSRMKQWHLAPNLLESLTMATTNFSGAALRALCRLITVHCINTELKNPRYELDYRTMLQLTEITARQYRILIGAETLPTLLLRLTNEGLSSKNDEQRFNNLSDQSHSVYTGKIIVNFYINRIDIEAIHQNPKTGEIKKVVYQEKLFSEETNLQQLVERLTFYGKSRNVQLLQLIDLNLLSLASAYDEKDKFEILKERLDECDAYRRSMIVYDLDSLVGINRSEGDSSMGRSTNLSLINHNIYTYIKDQFQSAYVEPTQMNFDVQNLVITKEKWSVMIIRDSFLARQFYEDTKFTRSERELEQEKADLVRAEQRIRCVQCNDYYIEDENKMGTCLHHDGFVYNNHSTTLEILTQHETILKLINEEAELAQMKLLTQEKKEKHERKKQRFKYICCNQTVQTSHTMQGCKKGKHGPRTMTIDEWNGACENNQEYENKRLDLLAQRRGRSAHDYTTLDFD